MGFHASVLRTSTSTVPWRRSEGVATMTTHVLIAHHMICAPAQNARRLLRGCARAQLRRVSTLVPVTYTKAGRLRHIARCCVVVAIACPAAAYAQAFDVMETTIPAIHAAMDARRLTCHQLVQAYLD